VAVSTLRVSVWRGQESGHFQYFEVPRLESQTVLDVVSHIQRSLDPTLSYRFACRVGMCGSCAMTVNGRARWTCRTHVSEVMTGDALEVRPLSNLPVIKDLVTATTRRDDFARVSPETPERRLADAGIECIGCGVCHSSCDVVAWNADYLGPAALNRAWTLVNDVRDTDRRARLAAVAGDAGCHACHTHMSCTERCPKKLSPTASIAGLKRATMLAALKGEL
jgi:fumarate reductase iron-sulfur subunit